MKGTELSRAEKQMLTRVRNALTIALNGTSGRRNYVSMEELRDYYLDGTLRSIKLRRVGKKTMELLAKLFTPAVQKEFISMTEAEYNAAEGIRRSDLWKMEDSPEKFRYYQEHPVEQTPAMAFGSACHKMILEPADFGNEYAVAPAVDKRTKEGKAQWEAFCNDNQGKTVVSADDAQTMAEMEAALERCTLANDLIRGDGQTEVPFFWTDPETGEKCKVKCDRIITGEDGRYYVIDYKTAASAETSRFNVDVFKLGYYMQAAMYTEGVMTALNLDYRPVFLFVVQEKKAPYSMNVIEVSDDVMKVGVAKFHELLEKYHDCKTVDIWPGYIDDTPNETTLPGWWSLQEEDA